MPRTTKENIPATRQAPRMNPSALPKPPRAWLSMPSYSSDIKMYLDERDLNTLRNPTNHISARVVNFFLWNIANQLTESRSWFGRAADGEDGICFLPSTVWSHFKSNSKCELVAYTRRNPFESGHIAIPFFEQDHWMLLVVAFAYHVNGGKDAIAEDEARTTAILFDPSTDKVAETTTIRATAIRLLKALAPKRQVRIGLLDRLKLERADIAPTPLEDCETRTPDDCRLLSGCYVLRYLECFARDWEYIIDQVLAKNSWNAGEYDSVWNVGQDTTREALVAHLERMRVHVGLAVAREATSATPSTDLPPTSTGGQPSNAGPKLVIAPKARGAALRDVTSSANLPPPSTSS